MLSLPPMPDWDGFHPLIVHFPIALPMAVPVLVILAGLLRRHSTGLLLSALVLLAIGSGTAWLAVESGEAAARMVDRTPIVAAAIEKHSGLAETTCTYFSVMTVVLALMLAIPALLRKKLRGVVYGAFYTLFILAYSGGLLIMINTGHEGGRLVHTLGVRTPPAARGPERPFHEQAAPVDSEVDE